jgi:hypothetical protein
VAILAILDTTASEICVLSMSVDSDAYVGPGPERRAGCADGLAT